MRVHEEPSNLLPAIYLAAAGVAAACAAILRPYDVDAAVERVYAVLKKTHVCTEDEYEASCTDATHTHTTGALTKKRARRPQTGCASQSRWKSATNSSTSVNSSTASGEGAQSWHRPSPTIQTEEASTTNPHTKKRHAPPVTHTTQTSSSGSPKNENRARGSRSWQQRSRQPLFIFMPRARARRHGEAQAN